MIKCLNFTLEVTRNEEPFLSVGHRHGSVCKHRQKSGNGIREARKISRSGAEKIMGRGGRKGSSWNWLQTTFLFPGTRSRLSRFFITNCFLLDARFAFWGRNALLSKFSLPRLARVGFEAKQSWWKGEKSLLSSVWNFHGSSCNVIYFIFLCTILIASTIAHFVRFVAIQRMLQNVKSFHPTISNFTRRFAKSPNCENARIKCLSIICMAARNGGENVNFHSWMLEEKTRCEMNSDFLIFSE